MALTKISSNEIQPAAITAELISADVSLGVKISNVSIANSAYTILDDTAVDTAGGYIVITGAGFNSGAQVIIGNTNATSVTRVSDTELRAQVPAKSAATYNLYVVNTDGSTGIRVNGLTYSATPTWVTSGTLDPQAVDVAFNVAFDATGAVSYANTTALPAGTTLLSNGYFYGTITGIEAETTYNFTIAAIDAENQDSPREFSVTVTVAPSYELYGFGQNNNGQLGTDDIINRSSPVQVGSGSTWSMVSSYTYRSLAIKNDGTLWGWGQNNGSLGLNDTINRSSPTQIGSLTTWSKAGSSSYTCCFLKTDGTIWGSGLSAYGGLGLNDITIQFSSPVQLGTGTDWSDIQNFGTASMFAIKTNGTLWAWGRNNIGVLGLGDIINRSSPVQVGTNTNWSKISAFNTHALAIKTNGTLWAWGENSYGQQAVNDEIRRSSPIQVGSLTDWNKVSAGHQHSMAIKNNGTLWAWGSNSQGRLGIGSIVWKSSPVQVGSLTTWTLVSAGFYSTMGIKSGELWSWGSADWGVLGLGDTVQKVSPVQVGTSNLWTDCSTSRFNSLAIKQQ